MSLEACLSATKKKEKECDEDKKECGNKLSICLVEVITIKMKLDACKIECEDKPHKKPCDKRRKHHHHH